MSNSKMTIFLNEFSKCRDNDKNERVACKKILSFCEKNNVDADSVLNYTEDEFKTLINYFCPTSLVELSNSLYRIRQVLKAYCYTYDIEMNNDVLLHMNKEELWNSLKENNDLKRYFSESKYREIVKSLDKDVLFDGNDLYYKTLFMAIYEGMYNKNLAEIKNLRASDIDVNTNIVTLSDDNNIKRTLEISDELKNNLLELSKTTVWYKIQGRSKEPIGANIVGDYPDSVFKVLAYNNKDKAKSCKEFYYRRLKTLSEEFLGYNTTPLQIFISGIMSRVYAQMNELDVESNDLKNDKNNYTNVAKFFIKKECIRVNYNVNIHSFMRILKSYAEVFDDNIK